MHIENRVARLEQERRERDWLRVMRKYPQISADEIDKMIASELRFRTLNLSTEQLEAFAATGILPEGVSFPEELL